MNIKIRKTLNTEVKPWTAKTKKEFIKLYREKGTEITEEEVYDILIYPYIDIDKTVFLSELEKQYILIEIKKASSFNKVNFRMSCDKCEKLFDVETTLDDVTHYHPSEFPVETRINKNKFSFRDIKMADTVKKAREKYPDEPPSYITMLLSIIEINDKPMSKLSEVMEFVENLPLPEFEKLEDFYFNKKSDLDLGQEITCPYCEYKQYYNFDIIPGFFDELLPKEV